MPLRLTGAVLIGCLAAALTAVVAAQQWPKPADVFGFEPGADYQLADYEQMLMYYRKLDGATERMKMVEIGKSVQGRPMYLAIVSSEENMRRLDQWRANAERLARGRIGEDEARKIAREGRAVVWVDGGLDDMELATGQMMPELIYRVVTEESGEMRKIRSNVITLLMPHMNPDASHNDVTWYREHRKTPWEITEPPRLGQMYVGSDNNRDWFMITQPETWAASRIFYHEWYPQIVFNHHQTGPDNARIFIPPYADPVNPNIHPVVTAGVRMVGAAMASRFSILGMPGYVSRAGYSMWWNGGMRLTPYFHNQIGILTETSHKSPTPYAYDLNNWPETLERSRGEAPRTDGTSIFHPDVWRSPVSRFRDAVDYMVEASLATLNLAANYSEEFQYNIWKMGRDAIRKGEAGNPFAYVIAPDQWDSGEALNLVNVLRRGGVEVHRATSAFSAGGKDYPTGSYIAFTAQAFRPHLVDLMEPQRYPDRREYPGGPPELPYDITGWTLPVQMGVNVERIARPFQVATEEIKGTEEKLVGQIQGTAGYGFALSHRTNASAKAVNQLLSQGERVHRADADFNDGTRRYEAGTFVVEKGGNTEARVRDIARQTGVVFTGVAARPAALRTLQRPRVGLYTSWVASNDQGWTLWLMENYAFAVDVLHDKDIRDGNLSRFHAIILPDQSADSILRGHPQGTMPPEFVGGLGAQGVAALDRFVQNGGTLIAFDDASDFVATQLGLPVLNAVANLPDLEFFIPGSLIRINVDVNHRLAAGMQPQTAASFQRSRAFRIVKMSRQTEGGVAQSVEGADPAVEVVARYAERDLLMSGLALGADKHIAGRPAVVRVAHGQGSAVLFAFRPQFRGQPTGTYKLIFNTLFLAGRDRSQATEENAASRGQ